jgi:hypothetical protein
VTPAGRSSTSTASKSGLQNHSKVSDRQLLSTISSDQLLLCMIDTSTNMMITSWRCPGCQHKRTAIPQGYFCFCGKQQNPNPKHYQTPHTCEELCKRSRKCPHPCVL